MTAGIAIGQHPSLDICRTWSLYQTSRTSLDILYGTTPVLYSLQNISYVFFYQIKYQLKKLTFEVYRFCNLYSFTETNYMYVNRLKVINDIETIEVG